MNVLLTIVGPTAVGKTGLAIALAKIINAEIISADSRQIYRYLDIGTAKPTLEERGEIEYHLIDFVEPDEDYSCGQFAREAELKIEEIKAKKKIPIICGGSGLYIKALFNPLHKLPQTDKKIKERLIALLNEKGIDYLYNRLVEIDKEWAKTIKARDKQRILRGLEVYEITGQPLSKLIKKERTPPRYSANYIGLYLPREILYQRIEERFDRMIKAGLIEETRAILKKGFPPDCPGLKTIGYKEIVQYLTGNATLEQAVNRAKQRTRNFAKRQLTWFSKIPGIKWYQQDRLDLKKIVSSGIGI